MSPATVATIACLALVAAAGMAVWVALQHRRTDELARSLTARKWDIVTLRAELGAIRRQIQGIGGDRTAGAPGRAGPVERDAGSAPDLVERAGEPVPDNGRLFPVERSAEAGHHEADESTRLVGGDGEPDPRASTGRTRAPTGPSPGPGPSPSPTAWRRDRARGASSRPRRRRPF